MATQKPPRKSVAIPEDLWWRIRAYGVSIRDDSVERLVAVLLSEALDGKGA